MPWEDRLVSLSFILALAAPGRAAAQGPPATDVFVAALSMTSGRPVIGAPSNATKRDGYDNQPAFIGDGTAFLFTSGRDGQTDIHRHDLATGETRAVTTTPESEYSATLVPGGGAISVIRVERDSAQRLWKFPLDGGAPSLVLERVRPVGYHAWADDQTLALFVLGSPNTLQLADTRTGHADTVTTNIGRSLHRMADGRVSFVHKVGEKEWWIEALDVRTRAMSRLMLLPEGVEDLVWLPTGGAIVGRGATLLWWSGKQGDGWQPVADFTGHAISGITRLAVSPAGDRLLFVALPISATR